MLVLRQQVKFQFTPTPLGISCLSPKLSALILGVVALFLVFQERAHAGTYDGEFFKDIEAIVVETSINQNQSESLVKDLLNYGANLPSQQQLDKWSIDAVQKRLKKRKTIKVEGGENSYVSPAKKMNSIFILVSRFGIRIIFLPSSIMLSCS